jgi:hypothetical protein
MTIRVSSVVYLSEEYNRLPKRILHSHSQQVPVFGLSIFASLINSIQYSTIVNKMSSILQL